MTTEFLSDCDVIWVSPKIGPKKRTWMQIVYWEVSQEVVVRVYSGETRKGKKTNTKCVHEWVAVQNCGHNPTGTPQRDYMEHTLELCTGMQEAKCWFTNTHPGGIRLEFPSMPFKQAKHTLVVTEYPQTETPEFLSCLAELPTRDFWESNSVCQTLLAGILLHQNAVVLSKWSSWYPQSLLWASLVLSLPCFGFLERHPWMTSVPKAKLLHRVESG